MSTLVPGRKWAAPGTAIATTDLAARDAPSALEAAVVICCYDEERWDSLLRTIASVRSQAHAPAEIVVAVDHNPSLATRLGRFVPGLRIVENTGARGASGTRNAGARHATTPVLVFLDDDVCVGERWLDRLLAPLQDPGVVGAGGRIDPNWLGPPPAWWPPEFNWVVGATYAGQPTTTAPVRNVWTGNMAVRRQAFEAVGGFRSDFGKVGRISRPEDTDLCLRISQASLGGSRQWVFVPGASVSHEISIERAHLRYFLWRCYLEGRGKVELARLNGRADSLSDESTYVRRVLVRALRSYVAEAVRRRRTTPLRRAAAVVAGLVASGAGAATAMAAMVRSPTPMGPTPP